MRWTRLRASEEGSEVVSTVLVQGLVVLVILLLAQIAFASHVRTMSVERRVRGGRVVVVCWVVTRRRPPRARRLLDSLVGAAKDREIAVDRESDAGVDILVVTVRTRLPLVGGFGPRWLTVHGRALVEGP